MMDTLWYFAYGSNLSVEKFTNSRGIVPLASVVACIPGWKFSMSIPGLPYREPAFASIEPINATTTTEKERFVEGVAYLVTRAQYAKIIASEGGDIAYAQAKLKARVLTKENEEITRGKTFHVLTLTNAIFKSPPGKPSLRYMDMVLSGAKTVAITPQYLQYLQGMPVYTRSTSQRTRIGASIFLFVWSPIMQLIEITVKNTANLERGGMVPNWVKTLVRFLVSFMWFSHEVHALFWGRGDGMGDTEEVRDVNHQNEIQSMSCEAYMPWGG